MLALIAIEGVTRVYTSIKPSEIFRTCRKDRKALGDPSKAEKKGSKKGQAQILSIVSLRPEGTRRPMLS